MKTIGLYSYVTGERLRDASTYEIERSRFACCNGYRLGVIEVDGAAVLTDEHEVQQQYVAQF